jgi:hypothetical protein
MDKKIELGCHGIVVTLSGIDPNDANYHTIGRIKSDLKEVCKHCKDPACDMVCEKGREWANDRDTDKMLLKNEELLDKWLFNRNMDIIEGTILAHAMARVKIDSPAYIEGIETIIEQILNKEFTIPGLGT